MKHKKPAKKSFNIEEKVVFMKIFPSLSKNKTRQMIIYHLP